MCSNTNDDVSDENGFLFDIVYFLIIKMFKCFNFKCSLFCYINIWLYG